MTLKTIFPYLGSLWCVQDTVALTTGLAHLTGSWSKVWLGHCFFYGCECLSPVELLIALCVICEYSDTNELLNRKPGLLETILAQLKTALTKENWKNSPVFKQGLIWVIKHVKVSGSHERMTIKTEVCVHTAPKLGTSFRVNSASNAVDVG